MDFSSWASRRSGRAPQEQQPPQQQRQPAPRAQQVAGAAAPTLPPAPAGFAWSFQAGQFVLIPLAQPQVYMQPPHQTIVAPVRQPAGVVPYCPPATAAGMAPGSTARLPETCLLVKPGNRDTYAELLASVPELVPNPGYDAEAGNPNPQVAAELRGCSEYHVNPDAPNPDAPLRSFTGGSPLIQGSAPLKGAAA